MPGGFLSCASAAASASVASFRVDVACFIDCAESMMRRTAGDRPFGKPYARRRIDEPGPASCPAKVSRPATPSARQRARRRARRAVGSARVVRPLSAVIRSVRRAKSKRRRAGNEGAPLIARPPARKEDSSRRGRPGSWHLVCPTPDVIRTTPGASLITARRARTRDGRGKRRRNPGARARRPRQ